MGLTERHWFEGEDVPENYEWALEDAVYNSCTSEKREDSTEMKILLEKQKPKQVIITTNSFGTKFYKCPRCNYDLYVYPRQKYCGQCGQAVKWDV